ncbi:MAG: hypothetical protein WCO33_03390 [bacterium]
MAREQFSGYAPDNAEFFHDKEIIRELVIERKIDICNGEKFPNIFIKAYNIESVEKQILWLDSQVQKEEVAQEEVISFTNEIDVKFVVTVPLCCLYPTNTYLKETVSNRKFANKPFTRMLALGMPQLYPLYFSPEALYGYVDNPKYKVEMNNICGTFYSKDNSGSFNDVFIQQLGFGINRDLDNFERSIALFPCDLSILDSFNQKYWHNYLLPNQKDFFLHPEYSRIVRGYFPENVSIFDAFLKELELINQMSIKIYGVNLFKNDYTEKKPSKFMYMLIPSKKEFNSFARTLSNMMGDNMDLNFFKKLGLETQLLGLTIEGTPIDKSKPTITLLNEWLKRDIKFTDPEPKEIMIKTFRLVQDLRSKDGAHKEVENDYDKKYISEQRDLMVKAYTAVRTLRLILMNNTMCKSVEVPAWIKVGKISRY